MDEPITDDYFFHANTSRNAFQSSALLQYQDIRAVQESGIPFNLSCALTTLDDSNTTYSKLIKLYFERGYGKLVVNHEIQVDSNSKNDWKYKDYAQLLWTQVSKILLVMTELEKCRKDLAAVLDNVTELYKVKDYPIVPDLFKDSIIACVDVHCIADLIMSKKSSLQATLCCFQSLSPSLQSSVAGDSYSPLATATQFFSPHYSLQLILDMIRPYRLIPLFEAVCTYAIDQVRSNPYTMPSEHFRYLRGISQFFFLLDGLMNQSVFNNKQIPLPEAQKLFRVYPYIPVEGDLVYDCYAMLSFCPNWDTVKAGKQYHIRLDRTKQRYLLEHKILQLRTEYLEVICEMEKEGVSEKEPVDETPSFYEPRYGEGLFSLRRSNSDVNGSDSLTESFSQSMTGTGSECITQKDGVTVSLTPREQALLRAFRLLRSLSLSLSLFWSWKLTHAPTVEICPICNRQVPSSLLPHENETQCNHDQLTVPAKWMNYACFTEFNFSEQDYSLLLHALTLTHSLSCLLRTHATTLSTIIHSLAYSSLQHLLKVDLLYWLHHADKHGQKLANETAILLKLRETVYDWLGESPPPPEQEYKLSTTARRELAVACVQRSVSPSHLQLVVLQALLSVFADPHSPSVTARFFPRFTLLRNTDLKLIKEHRTLLSLCIPLSSFSLTLSSLESASYFANDVCLTEMASSWAVPSSLRLPRLLHRYCLVHLSQIRTQTLLIPLQICTNAYEKLTFNDCIQAEYEQECGEMINLLVDRVSRSLYYWSKQSAISTILAERGQVVDFPDPLKLNIASLDMTCRVCDRSINLHSLLKKQLNSLVATDLSLLHTRLQASNLSFLIEFQTLLHLLQQTHSFIVSIIPLPPFTTFVTREFGSDTTTTGMNGFCQWLQQETIHLVCEGVFACERFILPSGDSLPPKHPTLFLYGGKKARQLLLQDKFQGFVGISHLQTLQWIGELLHVQWLPGLIHILEDQLDKTVGGLQKTVEGIQEHSYVETEDLAVLFKRMNETMKLTEDVLSKSVWECVTFSNIYAFLRMCEKCVWMKSNECIQEMISLLNDSAPPSDSYQSILRQVTCQSTSSLSLILHVLGRIAQMLAWDDSFCYHLPLFVDSFLLSLFSQSFLKETDPVQSILDEVIMCVSFLLMITRSQSRVLDNGVCMRFVTLCLSRNVSNDLTVNSHIKDFVKFIVHVADTMTETNDYSIFKQVADESQTSYTVNSSLTGYDCEVLLPSYVGLKSYG